MNQSQKTSIYRRVDKVHIACMAVSAFIAAAIVAFVLLQIDFIPNQNSVERRSIDDLLKLLFSIGGAVFAGIITIFTYTLVFFRQRPGDTGDGVPITGNQPLEIMWTLIPLVIVIGLGAYAAIILNKMTAPGLPQTELEVNVLAFRFGWQFTYPAYGVRSFELEMPVNQRVHFKIQSKDVVHSFWVQELGPKQDAVPGITTELYLTPTKIGQYMVQCSQLCGFGHTYMTAPARVVSAADFQTWVKQQQKTTTTPVPSPAPAPNATFQSLADAGQTVYSRSCAVCHGANGQGGAGPALWGPGNTPGKYNNVTLFNNTAQDMLVYISTRMPLNAPGSLSSMQNIEVLSYLLVQDNQVSPSDLFNDSQLSSIILK